VLNNNEQEIGDWKSRECKAAAQWRWLNELLRGKTLGRERIVKGFWRYGVEVLTF
jgi:hypothetical protein